MHNARREFIKDAFPKEGFLFDPTPSGEVVNTSKLASELFAAVPVDFATTRRHLRLEMMKRHFGKYSSQDYSKAVSELITTKKIFSETGKSRINDDVRLSQKPFGKSM